MWHMNNTEARAATELRLAEHLKFWARRLDLAGWDIELHFSYGKESAKARDLIDGRSGRLLEGFKVSDIKPDYREARVWLSVLDPRSWHMDDEELSECALHEMLHILLSPITHTFGEGECTELNNYCNESVVSQLTMVLARGPGAVQKPS